MRRRFALAAALAGMAGAWAQPAGPVKLVIGATPGGTVDTIARVLAEGMAAELRQPVIVVNRPGGNGIVSADFVARSRPDGTTLLLGTSGLTTLPLLQKAVPFRVNREFVPAAIVASTPFLLFAGPGSPASSLANLVAYARAHPNKLSAASGDGATLFANEIFKAAAGVSVLSVNYRGGPQMITDIAGGAVDFGFLGATAVLPLARAGKLRVLGVASERRIEIAPEIPTLAEQGVSGQFLEPWLGVLAPAGTPRATMAALEKAALAAAQSEPFRRKVADIGSLPRQIGADAAVPFMAAEQKMLEAAAQKAGIVPGE